MNEKLVEKFKSCTLSVNCKTDEEAKRFVSWCFGNGIKWLESNDKSAHWDYYQNETFYEYHYGYLQVVKRNTIGIDTVTFKEFFDIKPNIFTKSDLKSGMQIETRNGERYLVMLDYESLNYGKGVFIKGDVFLSMRGYKDDLTSAYKCHKYDIVKVYASMSDSQVLNLCSERLIWERKEAKEMTVNEVSELLGYDVKIVGD